MLKAVYHDFAQQKREQGANMTGFSQMPELIAEPLKCGKYIADDAGVRFIEVVGNEGQTNTVRVCYHPLIPTEYYENIEDSTHRVRLSYQLDEAWRSIVVDRSTIATRQGITALSQFGIDVTSETARHVVQYLADIEAQNPHPRIARSRSVSRMGWIADEFAPYLSDVKYDGQDGYRDLYESIAPVGSYEAWRDCMLEARKKDGHFRTQLAASFAAPVLGRLGGLTYFVHLWGGTEVGKTVSLMACASVWGNPEAGRFMRTLSGTNAGTEALAGFLCNLPICLNELQSAKNRDDMDGLIYQICEGQGRPRSRRTGGLRESGRWCTVALTNGEAPITTSRSGAGAINRVINLECDGPLFDHPRQVADTMRLNYGHAGREFIDRLKEVPIDDLRAQYNECLAEIQRSGSSTDKQQLNAAFVLLADKLATEWIFQDGRQLEAAELAAALGSREEVENAARSLEFVRGWIAGNRFRFDFGREGVEIWGKTMSDGAIAVIPSYLRDALGDRGFSYEAFLADMERIGVLQRDEKGRRQRVARFGEVTIRCVVLKMHSSEEQVSLPVV